MQRNIAFLITAATMLIAQSASAVVTLGFEINSIESPPLFEHHTNGTSTVTDDTLTADNAVSFTVRVNGTPAPTFNNAQFTYNADLVNYSNNGIGVELQYAGTFELRTAANELILSANFSQASTLLLAGGLFATPLAAFTAGEPLIYTPGPALMVLLPDDMTLGPEQSANFTVDNLTAWEGNFDNGLPIGTDLVTFSGTTFQDGTLDDNFIFDSSFSGTSELVIIPEPTSLALFLGGIALIARRSRTQA